MHTWSYYEIAWSAVDAVNAAVDRLAVQRMAKAFGPLGGDTATTTG